MDVDGMLPREVTKALKLPGAVVVALARSGLLGFVKHGRVSKNAVDQFRKYGTQWNGELGSREIQYNRLPVPPNLEGGEQPVSTTTELQIAPSSVDLAAADEDEGWIAQFYVRPNRFFFPSPSGLGLVGPVPVRLSSAVRMTGKGLTATFFPDPDGRLALVTVIRVPGDPEHAWEEAYDTVQPALDAVSLRADVPLPIAHSLVVGVPSGVMRLRMPKPAKDVDFAELDLYASWFEGSELLVDARALYREAVSAGNPFHQFLGLWRVYENVTELRGLWRQEHKRPDMKIRPERVPEVFAWRGHKGQTFDKVRQELRDTYRNALAHADPRKGELRSPATAHDYAAVSGQIPLLRYIARTTILNFEHTLRSTAGDDGALREKKNR